MHRVISPSKKGHLPHIGGRHDPPGHANAMPLSFFKPQSVRGASESEKMEKLRRRKAINGECKRFGQDGREKQNLCKIGLFSFLSRQILPVDKAEVIRVTFLHRPLGKRSYWFLKDKVFTA
ncbi:MAG TPA: hypothetical protein PKI05_14125, partial [Thermogutta sp.]|nr:hypothetical protein [Thermogutta sp.]